MEKLKFAILGCGRISKKHVEAIQESDEAKIVAVCDINEEKAMLVGRMLDVPYYVDYNEMLNKEYIDVVSILTPSGLHSEHTIKIASKYKKHIVCEKPMALNLKDADKMIDICENNHVKLFIVKQNRFNTAIQKLKQKVDKGDFGKIIMGTIRLRWARHQQYYDMDSWRGTWKMDGGCLTNQASHLIDLLIWVLGNPIEVSAMTDTRLLDIEVEDTGVAIVKFQSGALGIVEATTATRPETIEGSISILGEKGIAEIGGIAANEIKVWKFSNNEIETSDKLKTYNEKPINVYGFGHKKYLEHVIYCIKHDKQPMVDGIEGRKSIELINAIYDSSKLHKNILLGWER